MRYILFILISFLSFSTALGQFGDDDLIQFSGVIVDGENLDPIPFVNILDITAKGGTTSDYYGYFSFVASKGDSIRFSTVGYKESYFVIPDTLGTSRYSLIQMLSSDTLLLKEHVVYPWPTKEHFKEAFMNTYIPIDDLRTAQKNLAQAEIKARMQSTQMKNSGSANFKYDYIQRQQRLYTAGQYPSYTVLNPIAWAQFIKAWKRGDFKKKTK